MLQHGAQLAVRCGESAWNSLRLALAKEVGQHFDPLCFICEMWLLWIEVVDVQHNAIGVL